MSKKRFASLDFLRGLAIFIMLVLHIISDTLDIDSLVNNLSEIQLFQVILLVVLPFFGGLAGLFLIISAIGNMISMQKQLKNGAKWKDLMFRQITTGSLLLFFAMLSESILGYHGTLGDVFLHLNDLSAGTYDQVLWRFLFFETVHTIAWCIILNGIIHALLTKNKRWQNTQQLMLTYVILAIGVLVLTPVMWLLAETIIPGYPYAIDPITSKAVQFGVIGQTSFGNIVLRFFLGPLAAQWEPVFPYFAASFLGSIFGIYISQDKKEINPSFLKKFLQISLLMFIVGTIGVFLNVFLVINNNGLDTGLSLYLLISEHRYWTSNHGVPILGWLFQFLSLNGFSLLLIGTTFRLVEFRGEGKNLADRTKFIRRLGFIPFTIYTMQWMYNLFYFFVSALWGAPYNRLPWRGTLLILALTLLAFHVLTIAWEKVGYIGSLKWIIVFIRRKIVRKEKEDHNMQWWENGILDVQGTFYNVEWLDLIVQEKEQDTKPESTLAFKLSRLGFIFFPFSFIGYFLAKNAKKIENENDFNKKAKIMSLTGIFLFVSSVIFLFSVSLSTFGITL